MIDNSALMRRLLDEGRMRLERRALLEEPPPEIPAPHWDRVEGMLLGLAVGDALGRTSEGLSPEVRRRRHGEIRDYLPLDFLGGRRVGAPSDDTQLAFWTLEQLLADDGLVPERLAQRFASGHIYGIGQTVLKFLTNLKRGTPWEEAGVYSAGNGALMRIAPVLVPHLGSAGPGLWADAALAAMVTHNDPASTASCVAFVRLLWALLGRDAAPPAGWWLDTFLGTMRPLEGERTRYGIRVPLGEDYEGPVWRFVQERVPEALTRGLPADQACDSWYSGAYLLETVPSVLYILERHGEDPEEAIVRAVNDTRDNDTVAAIVGAAVGALHGRRGLPARWVDNLLGRTAADDDARVFALIEEARLRWGPAPVAN